MVNLLNPGRVTPQPWVTPMTIEPGGTPPPPVSVIVNPPGQVIQITKAAVVNRDPFNAHGITLGVCEYVADSAGFAANFAAPGVRFCYNHILEPGDTLPLGDYLEGYWLKDGDVVCGWFTGPLGGVGSSKPYFHASTMIFT